MKFLILLIGLILVSGCVEEEIKKEKTLEEKQNDLQQEIWEKETELYEMKFILAWYKMDLDAKEKNLTVEYKKIPDSEIVMRIEYNGSVFDKTFIEGLDLEVTSR